MWYKFEDNNVFHIVPMGLCEHILRREGVTIMGIDKENIEDDYVKEVEDLDYGIDDNLDKEVEIDHHVDFEVDVGGCKRKEKKSSLSKVFGDDTWGQGFSTYMPKVKPCTSRRHEVAEIFKVVPKYEPHVRYFLNSCDFISTLLSLVYSFESLLIKPMQGSGFVHFTVFARNDHF